MAVFMINICKFNGCGITFPSLGDLIQHIEDTHIDYDPLVIEQKEASQPSCLPLSYVLRFFTEASRRENANNSAVADVRRRLMSAAKPPSVRSSTPTGSEFDDEDLLSQSEDSNDSWTTVEEYSSEFILRYGSRISTSSASGSQGNAAAEKPFACPVPGCKKRYKNVNGIKYHSKNGHKKDGKVKKGFKCHCGKSYKTAQGLKNHSISQHFANHSGVTHASSLPPALLSALHADAAPLKPLSIPMAKTIHSLVVSPNSKDSQSRPLSRLIDAHIDSNKVIRAVLENANKSTKDGQVTTFTVPKHSMSNLQIIQNKDIDNIMDVDVNVASHVKQLSFSSATSTLGILTPASSPASSPVDKMKLNTKLYHHNNGGLPLTPYTPGHAKSEKSFALPASSIQH